MPASNPSPKTGSRPGDEPSDKAEAEVDASSDGRVAVELQHARGRNLRWILIGGIAGGLFVYSLGTLGQLLGLVLIGLGAWSAYQFVRTLLHPPGALVVDGDALELPRGVCRGNPSTVKRADVTAAYFLRRAVPWTQAAPVLVIEAGGRAFSYPRDWFASEADQRRILDALAPE